MPITLPRDHLLEEILEHLTSAFPIKKGFMCVEQAAPPVSAENIQLNAFNTKTIGSAAKCVVFITNQTRQILGDMGGSVKVL